MYLYFITHFYFHVFLYHPFNLISISILLSFLLSLTFVNPEIRI